MLANAVSPSRFRTFAWLALLPTACQDRGAVEAVSESQPGGWTLQESGTTNSLYAISFPDIHYGTCWTTKNNFAKDDKGEK